MTTTKENLAVGYISKAQAIERLKLNFPLSDGADNSKERYRYMQALADLQAIRELPSVTPQELKPMVEIDLYSVIKQKYIEREVLDKIRSEILDCLKALDEIEKSGLNIYLPNEISGRRLTYQQCLEFIDKYKAEGEPQESEDKE